MKHTSNVDLSIFNTLGISAKAKDVYCIEAVEDIIQLNKQGISLNSAIILGGGSNVIFSQAQIERPVLINNMSGIETITTKDGQKALRVASGENWDAFVDYSIDARYFGLENLALIPGTVGAAPIQNIGAYGVEVKDYIHSLRYFDYKQDAIIELSNTECQFSYRDSVFKQALKGLGFIIDVSFVFPERHIAKIDYPGIKDALGTDTDHSNISAKAIASVIRQVRQSKLPDPQVINNVGSFFKNPIVANGSFDRIKQKHPQVPGFVISDSTIKLSAAWLIEQCGWKGYIGESGAGVSDKHALVLVNRRKASGEDILFLAKRITESVQAKFAVTLEIEPVVI